jgi:ATP-dependent DNA ligase|tara:strand:+ start:5594 stop:8095 length:2502 start_codon:yes stop_codon:yes gene_type:complete
MVVTGRIDPLSRSIRLLYDKVRIAYLSARERPKDYRDNWETVIEDMQQSWDSPQPIGDLLRDKISESLLFSEEAKDPQGSKAKRIYETLKNIQNEKSFSKDPFRKKYGSELPKKLLQNKQLYAIFLHWVYRTGRGALDNWKDFGKLEDNFTEGYVGLDLTDGEIFEWLESNYGEEVDVKRLKSKMQAARELLYEVYTSEHSPAEWQELTDTKRILKQEKDTLNNFIIPNKPMYRIFEIDDMKELKGFTGEYIVQEKYDGMRIQIHKKKEIKVYSFNNRDITSKFDRQIKIMQDEKFPDCVLDAEVVLYENDEPLHRADTISFINSKNNDSNYELKVHVFDIMRLNGEHIWKNKLEDRLTVLMGEFTKLSDKYLQFPNKSNTRSADSLEEIEEYAKEIMNNPTSEGVMIKDAKSSYIVGKKKNPKWVKWKKFVDLDLLVLDIRKNKNGTFSYTLGAGPLGDEDYKPIQRYDKRDYLVVGKALNTKIKSEIGKIIRVKVDEVKKTKTGFSVYSAKVIEKPEVTEPEKVITLEFLSKDNKKSASDYNIEALKKSYAITDNIHGIVELNTSYDTEGFVLSGFYQDNLMAKNAIIDIDIWKEELASIYKKDSGKLMTIVSQIVQEGEIGKNELLRKVKSKVPDIIKRVFSDNNIEKSFFNYVRERGEAFGVLYNSKRKTFYYDDKTLVKLPDEINKEDEDESETYEVWKREDGDLNFIYTAKGKTFSWRIEQDNTEDIYELFGKATKYLAEVDDKPDKQKLLDEGKLELGAQRDGYHEYILDGKMYQGKFHIRVVPIMEEDKWVAWTGYETKPTDKDSDDGLWDIEQDKYKNITFSNE